MMDLSQRKEQFSFAYVRAVAAAAGFAVSEPSVDDDSIDLQIAGRSTAGSVTRPRLEVQVKCTADVALETDRFSYPLPVKNYDDLRDANVLVPRVLMVVRVPADVDRWVVGQDDRLCLHHCGYWASLRGMPGTENAQTVSIRIDRVNRIDPGSLHGIMERIGAGGEP